MTNAAAFEGFCCRSGSHPAVDQAESDLEYAVIGHDDRFQITPRNQRPSTLLFPFNTICLLEIDTGSGVASGTGTLIAPQVVLTAKHCLMNVKPPCAEERHHDTRRLFRRITVTPGAHLPATIAAHRRPATPSSIAAAAARFRAHPTLDYGVIILPRPFVRVSPRQRAWRGQLMTLQARSTLRTATLLTIAGFPCDKPRGTMWAHSERIPLTGVSDKHLFYTIDTCPGHSGSPIWLLGNDGIRLLLGIHTAGPGGCDNDPLPGTQCRPTGASVSPSVGQNCGVRVTCDVIRTIRGWCREFGVSGPVVDNAAFRRQCERA